MAIQYIGARYVPAFADPIEWDNTRTYEPLTIVTRLGDSYTSKKAVPVGADILDTEYWVLTGNYNGQIAALTQQVGNMQTDVNDAVATAAAAQADVLELRNTKAAKSQFVLATLTASWVGDAAPYTQTITAAGMTVDVNAIAGLSPAINAVEKSQADAAGLVVSGQGTNTVTFKAFGEKPTVSIPVAFIILG